MNSKIKAVMLVFSITLCGLCSLGDASAISVDIDALKYTEYYNVWLENKSIQFNYEGIHINMTEKFTRYYFIFTETLGRDVNVIYRIPKTYIPVSAMGLIEIGNRTVTWRTGENESVVSFTLIAFSSVNFNVSKTSLLYGGLKKSVHNFWNYVEYNGDSKGEDVITVRIDKEETGFEIDNKHMIVQYKTKFHNWYYPVEDYSSAKVAYYYVTDLGNTYEVVIRFKNFTSADIKVEVFRGASEGVFNFDALRGSISKGWISMQVGIKKAIIDLFGGPEPNY